LAHLILHIGSHKTGTTSLQTALRKSSKSLAAHGIKVADRHVHNQGLVNTTGRQAAFQATLRPQVAEQLLRPDAETVVCSNEMLFWLHDPAEVAHLARMISDRFDTVQIFAYLRRQDLLVLSHRKQIVLGRVARDFYGSDFLSLPEPQPFHRMFLDYDAKITRLWGEAFGTEAITLVPYERESLIGQDVVQDFATRLNLPLGQPEKDRNAPLGAAELLAGLAFDALGLPHDTVRPILQNVAEQFPDDSRKILPTRDEARRFVDYFAESNARLAETFSHDGQPFGFSDDYSAYPEADAPVWTSQEVMTLLRTVVPQAHALPGKPKRRRNKAAAEGAEAAVTTEGDETPARGGKKKGAGAGRAKGAGKGAGKTPGQGRAAGKGAGKGQGKGKGKGAGKGKRAAAGAAEPAED